MLLERAPAFLIITSPLETRGCPLIKIVSAHANQIDSSLSLIAH